MRDALRVRLGHEDFGAGEPALLFLTGWCSSRTRWTPVAERCGSAHRVLNMEWRGHGDSAPADGDFGLEEMVQDALAVVEASGVETFIPCSASHSGWVAIELRRRHPERVPKIVHVDWMVVEPSGPYMELLGQLQSATEWIRARDALFGIWRAGVESSAIDAALEVMAAQGQAMWMRSGRVIEGSYRRWGSPLAALSALDPPPPVLHLYGQPPTEDYLQRQRRFAAGHGWFSVERLAVRSHFAMLEAPAEVAAAIERFVPVAQAAGDR